MTGFLIDAGAFLAMIDVSDSNHVAAALFVRSHSADSFYVPDTVFAETMVLIKARLGARPAVDLGDRIRESRQFLLVPLTPDDHEATWTIFSRYTDKDWSYVDCSTFAMSRRLNIPNVFAFDHHFDQMVELARVP